MKGEETVKLAAGTVINAWPAAAGGGAEISLAVRPAYVVVETGSYLVSTDSVARKVTFRRCAEQDGEP